VRDSTISARDIGWAILRVAVGAMFITHGYGKIFGETADGTSRMVTFASSVASMGFPSPELFAWVAALSELIGGSLIVIGLFTRFASLFAASTMLVAAYSHLDEGYKGMELPMLFGVVFVVLLVAGSGRFSFDAVRQAKKEKAALSIFR